MTTDDAVVCTSLTVRRGRQRALDGIDASVARGAITGMLGPSGSGKSTLIRAIVGTQAHVQGTVTVLGRPAGSRALRARVGYVTQASAVYPDLTVRENIAYFARLQQRPGDIDDVLATVDLTALARHRARDLSGGQLRRVSIASALIGEPDLLILDEPTVGLDPVLRADLWHRFRRLADSGTTMLVSSHVMDEADHCDSLILLREGRLVATTTAAAMRAGTGCSSLDAAFLALLTESGPT
ncbi:putative ABC transporter ATP-binding protein [Gordonia hirsuta DSM 44140 = NBRC 16056]|uniref:Putative ABC transporter ATP-binding protein n=1 Tax=Gordonia hirsuta DSM 44140 = NBRC 16056 TaxID=1121927 RepID=L7L9M5_9ACTN|nr:ABC transporter ATP-binding protein [Gordonia hirsuta]GAC57446.1 putative ABC transporter ATP-binding protein [Gordonia hirsuta DSM 44140 = NBRC 16056]